MGLRENISDILVSTGYDYKLKELEKIVDNYAIEFAEWIQFHSELWIKYKTSELLEIFKKEMETIQKSKIMDLEEIKEKGL